MHMDGNHAARHTTLAAIAIQVPYQIVKSLTWRTETRRLFSFDNEETSSKHQPFILNGGHESINTAMYLKNIYIILSHMFYSQNAVASEDKTLF